MSRKNQRDNFLNAAGWGKAKPTELAADASFRRYYRLKLGGQARVLMDAPPTHESVNEFISISNHLRAMGLNAPKILNEDRENGFLLIEDFGDKKFSTLLESASAGDERCLYQEAVTLLCTLQRFSSPSWLSLYTIDVLLREADLFIDWYLPTVKSARPSSSVRNSYRNAWKKVLGPLEKEQNVLVLRDYHADNLMWLPDRLGVQRVGLLDFQDALSGSPVYDLVSLLEDVRRDVNQDLAYEMKEYYLTTGVFKADNFEDLYAVLGAQRNAKILGIFIRLSQRDGKNQYLELIPRTWNLLERHLKNSALEPVQRWVSKHVTIDDKSAGFQAR